MATSDNDLKNFSNLVCGDNYFVSQCRKCDKIKFNFNNVLFDMSPEKFREFAKLLNSITHNNAYAADENALILINYNDQKELTLIFDREEFAEIKKIIHESILLMDVNELIEEEKVSNNKNNN